MAINLRKITQGERGTLTFTWEFPENLTSPASILGAAITATMTDEDGLTTAVSGTLTGTAATVCTWALSVGDSGTAGTFTVLFKAVATGVTTYTLEATLEVIANPAVTGTQNDPLVSISAADAAWVTLAATAVPDGGDVVDANDLGTAAYAATGDFDAAGAGASAAAALLASDQIDLGTPGTIMDLTIASANTDAPWTLTTRQTDFDGYRDDWMNFGNNMYPVGDNSRAGWSLQMENGYKNPGGEYTSEAFFQYFEPGSSPVVGEVRRPFQINMFWADNTSQLLISGETRFRSSDGSSTMMVIEDGGNAQVQNGKYLFANNNVQFIKQTSTGGTAKSLLYLSNSDIIIFGETGVNSNIVGNMSFGDFFGPANVLDVRGTRTPSANYQAVSITTTISPTAGTNFYGLYTKPTINIPTGMSASYAVGNYFAAPTVNKAGTGAVTYTATVYISGAPSGGVQDYALWVPAGNVRVGTGDFRADGKFGFGGASPQTRQTVVGSRGGNAALASLLTMLAYHGIITDGTTA